DEQRRRHRRIHAAGHRNDNTHLIKGKPRNHETLVTVAFRVSQLVFNAASSRRIQNSFRVFVFSWPVFQTLADAGFFVNPRSFSTSRGSTSATRSTSSVVENSPRLKRSEFCVRCAGKPIAR